MHCGDLSLRFTVFSPGKPSWECVTLAAVPDKCPLIGMDGGYGAPAMRRSHALTTQCAPKLRLMSQTLKTIPNLICLLGLRVTSRPTPLSLCRRTNLHEVRLQWGTGKIFAHQCEKTRLNPCVGSCIIIANAITSLSGNVLHLLRLKDIFQYKKRAYMYHRDTYNCLPTKTYKNITCSSSVTKTQSKIKHNKETLLSLFN